tara:strand:+ start:1244 stop:1552 length:309 start_codon:yes stop_codon:yes gene_type:complete
MRNLTMLIMGATLLFLAASCGDKEEKACDAGETTADVVKKEKEDKNYLCYIGCLEAEKTKVDCKKACYAGKKGEKDVVDSPDDATATKSDAVDTSSDVTPTK